MGQIPFERFDAVTLDDSGVGENAGEAFVIRKAAAEDAPRDVQNVLLQEGMGRDRGRKREKGSRHQQIFRVGFRHDGNSDKARLFRPPPASCLPKRVT